MRFLAIPLFFVAMAANPVSSAPSSPTWWDGFGLTGIGGNVNAIVPYNGGLVVAGGFESVGNTKAVSVAFWTGTEWQAMGEGVPGGVQDLVVYNGNLVAGGESVYEWDGGHWNELGGGTNSTVLALTVYEDKLIAGGFFDMVGPDYVGYIAQWDGNSWQPVGNGFPGWVIDLSVFGDKLAAAGYLVAQHDTTSVAEWNGSTWNPLPASGSISFLQGSGDSLFIGGEFPVNGDASVERLAVWNGASLSAMGPALDFNPHALKFVGGELFLGGDYRIDPFLFNYRLAKWDGNDWIPQIPDTLGGVNALEEFQNDLIVGGYFETIEGKVMNGISRKTGDNWLSLGPGEGMSDYVAAFTEMDGSLVAGGRFRFAGQTRVNGVAQWDGQTWHAFGSGMSQSVQSLAFFSDKLIAGGEFTLAEGMPALHIVEWNGAAWSQLGAGFDDYVWALEVFHDSLYAGGKFAKSGNLDVTGIAKWDGQNWTALPDLSNPQYAPRAYVNALLNYGTNAALIVGGDFRDAAGISVNHVARWDGTSWSAMGEGFNNPVEDLCEFQGAVIACGGFTTSGTGPGTVIVNRVARWNGTSWQGLGSGFPDAVISDVEVFQGVLFAAGYVPLPDDAHQTFVEYWDGQTWQKIGDMGQLIVNAMHAMGNSLYVGGAFSSVNDVPAYNIARLDGFDAVPVRSLRFEANRTEESAVLNWEVTGSLEDLAAFRLDRRGQSSEAPTDLGVVQNDGGTRFQFVDTTPLPERTEYRLWGLDRTGASTWLGSTLLAPANEAVPRLALLQSTPNPCRGATMVTFRLRESTSVNLRILDSSGREVIRLLSGPIQAGQTTLSWNGQDRRGQPVPSGIYYYQVDTPFERVSRRLVVVK
jgi:trimeric autotransporter adhesin